MKLAFTIVSIVKPLVRLACTYDANSSKTVRNDVKFFYNG